jgi:predicted porin
MKTAIKLMPLALAACVGTAFAEDSGVTLYGILDVGVAHQNHSFSGSDSFPVTIDNNSAIASTKSFTGMVNGPLSDSRWGIKGNENIGGGLSAHFVLESGFNLPTGQTNNAAQALAVAAGTKVGGVQTITALDSSLSGQFFNRAANVGLTDAKLGTIDFGRVYAPGFDVVGAYDPQKGSQLFSPLGFSGSLGGALGYTEMMRSDNSLKYSNVIDGVNVRAMYKFGGIAGNSTAGSGYGVNVGYEASNFGVQAVYQGFKDVAATGSSSNVTGGVAATLYDTAGWMLTGKYKQDALTVKAGYEAYKRKASSDSAATLGSLSEFGYAFSYTAPVTAGAACNSTGNPSSLCSYSGADKNYKVYWFGGDYNLSSSLNLAAAFYSVKYDGTSATTATKQNYASLVLDDNLSKRTDVYVGIAQENPSGPGIAAAAQQNVRTFAFGMRHRF